MYIENRVLSIRLLFVVALSVIALAMSSDAALPVPSFVYYGEVVDEYGWPIMSDSKSYVIARVDGRECARSLLHEGRGPSINYRIEVPVDDGNDSLYDAKAALPGDRVTFTVLVDGTELPVMDVATIPAVGDPGNMVRWNLIAGQDADNDGLPDAWEEWIIQQGAGSASNIAEVIGADDADGDGMSNVDEFIAGTDPAWSVDLLQIEEIDSSVTPGRIGIAFYSIPGKTYRVVGGQTPTTKSTQAISSDVGIASDKDYWRGDGYYAWLYVNTDTNSSMFLQIEVE